MYAEAIYIGADLMNSDPGSKGAQQPFAIGGKPKPRIEITDAVVEMPTHEQRIYRRERRVRYRADEAARETRR